MAAASSGRAEVDTSRAFRSVKEAVAVFGERILARETQLRQGGHADRCVVRERSSWPNATAVVAAKLDGGRPSGLLVRKSPSKLNAIANAKHEGGDGKPASNLMPVADDVSMCLVPSYPPFFAPSPPPRNDDDSKEHKESNLMVMTSIKRVEEEAAKTRQEVFQVKKRMTEMELAMATLNAKLHRTLSKLAHMEADRAAAARASTLSKMAHMEADRVAAARASIQQQRDGDTAALTVWTERRLPPRQQLGHLLSLGKEAEEEEVIIHAHRRTTPTTMTTPTRKRKVEKEKPIVPLVVPLINGVLFSKKKRMKDKESLYMKELYSLLRLT